MNYYEHHIGDYAEATSHLSFAEDAAYSRCIRKYYASERPLPADVKQVQRLVGARTKEEREAVETVLKEFFELRVDGWHQDRCDAEIERYQSGEPEREARKANEDNRLRRHREERASLFKQLTDAGQHAPWNIAIDALRALVKSLPATPPETPPETLQVPFPATEPATPATATQAPPPIPSTSQQELLPTAGADAPPSPAAKAADPIWHTGLAMLIRKGVPEEQARKFVGKLKRECGDITAAALLAEAEADDITEPIPWLATGARNAKARAANPKPSAADNFTGKTYQGTAIDDLPPTLRAAARAALAAG